MLWRLYAKAENWWHPFNTAEVCFFLSVWLREVIVVWIKLSSQCAVTHLRQLSKRMENVFGFPALASLFKRERETLPWKLLRHSVTHIFTVHESVTTGVLCEETIFKKKKRSGRSWIWMHWRTADSEWINHYPSCGHNSAPYSLWPELYSRESPHCDSTHTMEL